MVTLHAECEQQGASAALTVGDYDAGAVEAQGLTPGDGGQPLWNVHSFVRTENTSSTSLNIKDFVDEVVARGLMPSSRYLTSLQAGLEVFVGDGSLSTTSFSRTIQ